jgi:hypothetical protein
MNQNSVRSSAGVPPPLPFSVRSSGPPPLPTAALDFRTEAIRNLEVLGKEFDEYDIELEMNKLKSKHQKAESLRLRNLERERSLGVVSSSGVVPPPLPISAPPLPSSPPPLLGAVPLSSPPPLPGSPLADRDEPDFRIEAIRHLKAAGKPFDEYDIELEIEEVKSAYIKKLKADRFSGAGLIC